MNQPIIVNVEQLEKTYSQISKLPYLTMDGLKITMPVEGEDNQAIKEIINDYVIHVMQNRTYEPETIKVIRDLLKEGDIAVDVGASIGYVTMNIAKKVGPSGHVYAFEPTDNQFKYLEANIKANELENITPYSLAAWDKEESDFVRRDDVSDNKNKIQTNAGIDRTKLRGVVLDDILPEKIDFIKMDVDGSEPRALSGLIKTFERNPQLKLVIEYYPACILGVGNRPEDMMAILDTYFTYEKLEGDYGDEYWNYLCRRK